MKTAELVRLLAENVTPAPRVAVAPRLLGAALVGAAVAAAVLVFWPAMAPMGGPAAPPPYWLKAGYTLVLAACGWLMAARLSRPGGRVGPAAAVAVAAVLALAALAAVETLHAHGAALATLWLGHAADNCAARIVVLSVPTFIAALWTMKRMAPTRPALAGAAAGLFAGAVAATVYGFFCTETSAAFVVAWYTLGVAVCAGLGALVGARALRW